MGGRRTVTVIDAVDYEARLEHDRVSNRRVVLGVGVLLDVEILSGMGSCPRGYKTLARPAQRAM